MSTIVYCPVVWRDDVEQPCWAVDYGAANRSDLSIRDVHVPSDIVTPGAGRMRNGKLLGPDQLPGRVAGDPVVSWAVIELADAADAAKIPTARTRQGMAETDLFPLDIEFATVRRNRGVVANNDEIVALLDAQNANTDEEKQALAECIAQAHARGLLAAKAIEIAESKGVLDVELSERGVQEK